MSYLPTAIAESVAINLEIWNWTWNIYRTEFDDEDYLLSEVKRMIDDALLINPHIKSVEDVEVDYKNEKLGIKCTVNTKYGDIYVKIWYNLLKSY